jgi:hypothetical protein
VGQRSLADRGRGPAALSRPGRPQHPRRYPPSSGKTCLLLRDEVPSDARADRVPPAVEQVVRRIASTQFQEELAKVISPKQGVWKRILHRTLCPVEAPRASVHELHSEKRFDTTATNDMSVGSIARAVASEVTTGLDARFDSMERTLMAIYDKVSELARVTEATNRLTRQLLEGQTTCPRMFVLVPDSSAGSALASLDISQLYQKQIALYFVCGVCLRRAATNDGQGYKLTVTKEWVREYAPAIQIGIKVLQIGCFAARLWGVPMPVLPNVEIPLELEAFEEYYGPLMKEVEDASPGLLNEAIGAILAAAREGREDPGFELSDDAKAVSAPYFHRVCAVLS